MSIRIAIKQDSEALSKLVISLAHFYQEKPSEPLPKWIMDTLQPSSFESRINHSGYLNLVYEESSEIKGYISIKDTSHLYHLFVHEELHGKGIARQLWLRARSHFPESHHYTLRSSLFAIPVYSKFGFYKTDSIAFKDGIGFQPMAFNANA